MNWLDQIEKQPINRLQSLNDQQRALIENITRRAQLEVDQVIRHVQESPVVKWEITITFHGREKEPTVSIRRIDSDKRPSNPNAFYLYNEANDGSINASKLDFYC